MNKQVSIWQLIDSSLQQGIPVMLLYVLESNGSSPGRQGFCMAVNAHGNMQGSIGGGIMEHKFVEMARERLRVQGLRLKVAGRGLRAESLERKADVRKQVHDKAAATNQSGMICSGEQTILVYTICERERTTVQQIIASLQTNQNGTLTLSPNGLSFSSVAPDSDFSFVQQSETKWVYREKTGYKNHLYVIGAGHCALALTELMSKMDFHIHLYDNRENLNTFQQNTFVQEKIIVDDYKELEQLIPSGYHHYVVIMTFGYRTDTMAIKALLHKQFRYIGVLGSKKKMEKLFEDFSQEGIDETKLRNLYTPIGIHIKSETPEEIAVSIAAEIISVKNSLTI